ncbi:MAG: leucine--tRNA ligase, partial [Chloroflexota bacterium]
WPDRVVTMQTNWIGKSEGASVSFTSEEEDLIEVFTTRPDTLWGATFMVLAPEHSLVDKLTTSDRKEKVQSYVESAARLSDIDRMALDKEKTGVFTGAYAINPVNGAHIPIWIADYVLMTYGSGAIMAVPAHDERDFEFALKFGMPIIPVIDRIDDRVKSFVRPGSYNPNLIAGLDGTEIKYQERDGALFVELKSAQVDTYLALLKENLETNAWTELVGASWLYVFAHEEETEIVPFDSVEADKIIVSHCRVLDPSTSDCRTVMELLHKIPYYRDLLFHHEYGDMIHSGPLTGTSGNSAVDTTTEWLQQRSVGEAAVNYRLHDWVISRQRYWGTPIPMVYCQECGTVPLPYSDLPVELPDDVEFMPSGESPLKFHDGFLHTTCPKCGGAATRETDTMDTFMCSSWYQYAYLSPYYRAGESITSNDTPVDPQELAYWSPVDLYTGGIEHATMHLIYTRFFTKTMRDMGLVDYDEPMLKLRNQGIVLGEDHEKMSKSRGNVVAPDELIDAYGADTVRLYLMFFARFELGGPWDSKGIKGPRRFLDDVWSMVTDPADTVAQPDEKSEQRLQRKVHQTVRRVTEDIESFSFNTAVAAMMELRNTMRELKKSLYGSAVWTEAIETLLLILAPFAPHITEELWGQLGKPYSVHTQSWPQWDAEIAAEPMITLVIQINGKVRDRIEVPAGIDEDEAKQKALESQTVAGYLQGREVRRTVYVPGRLINIVI